MTNGRRILYALTTAAAAVGLAVAAVTPAAASGPFHIKEANGSYYIGANSLAQGASVITVGSGGARDMTWTESGGTYGGDNVGNWRNSSGNEMAETNNCSNVVWKAPGATGTAWTIHYVGSSIYLINRYCDQQQGSPDTQALAGRNSSGQVYTICGSPFNCTGWYLKVTFIAV